MPIMHESYTCVAIGSLSISVVVVWVMCASSHKKVYIIYSCCCRSAYAIDQKKVYIMTIYKIEKLPVGNLYEFSQESIYVNAILQRNFALTYK